MSVNEPHPIPSSDVTFTCDFTNMDANPGVDSVQWFKDEETLTWSDSSFHIKDVNADDNGNYSCRVGNAIAYSNVSNQIELSVNYSAFCRSILLLHLDSLKETEMNNCAFKYSGCIFQHRLTWLIHVNAIFSGLFICVGSLSPFVQKSFFSSFQQ